MRFRLLVCWWMVYKPQMQLKKPYWKVNGHPGSLETIRILNKSEVHKRTNNGHNRSLQQPKQTQSTTCRVISLRSICKISSTQHLGILNDVFLSLFPVFQFYSPSSMLHAIPFCLLKGKVRPRTGHKTQREE
jgi:hypothetical protein